MNLGEAFARAAARTPDEDAIVDGALRLTYADWYARVRSLAGALRALGLGRGDRLAVVLANRWQTATLYWACQMLGAVFTPFNWRAGRDEIAFVLADSEARAVAFDDRSCGAVALDAEAVRLIDIDGREGLPFADLLDAEPVAGPAALADGDVSLMLYTSGTTGRPKGVPRSHAAESAAGLSAIAHLGYHFGERQLGVMPLFHTMGVRTLLTSALLGGPFVAMPSFAADAALGLIAEERITALFLVPTLFHDLVHDPGIGAADLSSVRAIAFAGMAMSEALTARCAEVFRPQTFCNFYGSSEIFTFTVCDHVADKPGCAGRAGLGQEVRVVRAGGSADERVAPGEIGEIIASMGSPEAFAGYWKRPDADARAIRGAWYFTGDLGRFDDEGEFYVCGRVDDMIISGGENIYPEEVETALAASPLVRQAAVVGMPDARWGEAVVAFVEPAGPATAEALDRFCLDSGLARFKRPRAYVFVADLPRSAAGKLLRRRLRAGDYTPLPGYRSTLQPTRTEP